MRATRGRGARRPDGVVRVDETLALLHIPRPSRRPSAGDAPTENMVSSSQQFERIRKRKATKNGKSNKRARRRIGTPAFAIHPEGYDPKAADARPAEAAKKA